MYIEEKNNLLQCSVDKMKTKKTLIALKTNLIILFLLFLSIASAIEISAQTPSARANHQLVYDAESDRIILYGGVTVIGDSNSWVFDTWAYDYNENTWTKLQIDEKPYSCIAYSLAYDAESDVIIQYGGIRKDHVGSNQTWIFDYNEIKWFNVNPLTCPDYRNGHRLVYDSESDVIVLFGGSSHPDFNPYGIRVNYSDTWTYDYNSNSWTNMKPAIIPPWRHSQCMAYDSESDKTIVFGGVNLSEELFTTEERPYLADTWAYDYNTKMWENLTTSVGPEARVGSSMVYDSESDRCILFGGYHHMYEDKYGDETWAYDYNTNTWEQMDLEGTSPWKYVPNLAYDSNSDRVVMFGGLKEKSFYEVTDETWTYDYNSDTWELMEKINGTSFSLNSFLISLNIFVLILTLKKRIKMKRGKKNEK